MRRRPPMAGIAAMIVTLKTSELWLTRRWEITSAGWAMSTMVVTNVTDPGYNVNQNCEGYVLLELPGMDLLGVGVHVVENECSRRCMLCEKEKLYVLWCRSTGWMNVIKVLCALVAHFGLRIIIFRTRLPPGDRRLWR